MAEIPEGFQRLEGSERRPAVNARLLGPADAGENVQVTIVLRRRPDGQPAPGPEYFAANPPGKRQRMPEDEFVARYGASPEDVNRVVEFATAQGLTAVETNLARRTVVVSGSVAQMNQAFAVDLGRYEHEIVLGRNQVSQTETYRGRDGFIHVPTDLAEIIVGVFGLDNRGITKLNGADPPGTTTVTVPQVTQLYNFPPNSAAGQTIAIFCGLTNFNDGYKISDINQYFTGLGLAVPAITEISVHGTNSGSDPFGEITQDIDICGSAAPGAAIAVYFTNYTQQGWVDCIGRVVHPNVGDPVCSVLSSSYYVSNGDDAATLASDGVSVSWLNAVTMAFHDAAIQGVTVCIATGDTGTDSKVGDGRAHTQYPASDPWVLAVGGTTIGNISGTSFDEYVWNDSFFAGFVGATGGGVSDFFNSLPGYQSGAGVPASLNDGHTGRGFPDVAANASPNSGYPVIVGGSSRTGNGTSASAPLWAGLIAVINAALGENVGFVNPALYALGSSVFRDIVGAPGPAGNGLNGVAGYPAGAGWDACTGWGSPNGAALLAGLQQLFAKDCVFITDRNTFGKEEIAAMLASGPAVIPAAFYVEVDGFRASDLGITAADLSGPPLVSPLITPPSPVSGMSIGPASALFAQDSSLPPARQRFTWVYPVTFTDTTGFIVGGQTITLTASIASVSGSAQIQLIETENPFEVDGPISWLSSDTRVFKVKPGETWFNAPPLGATPTPQDASNFIKAVIQNLNAGTTGGQIFDSLSSDENASSLALYEFDHTGTPVFNFALARVRYRAFTDAPGVRVFFRLCPALSVSVDYDQTTTYRRWATNLDGQPIPLLGIQSGNLVTIPFFAEPRTAASMHNQTDPANVQTITAAASGAEVQAYFGCWLDINRPGDLLFPLNPVGDGPYSGSLNSILQLVRNQHQCMLTEIAFDPDPITGNPNPAVSDKLAQRNLSLVLSDNPGDVTSRRIPNLFEFKPTPFQLPAGEQPDELLIDWSNLPAGSTAEIHMPAIQASDILAMASKLYTTHFLTRVDDHTLGCEASGITYVPVPPGSNVNFIGLLTVDLPEGIRKGQLFKIVVQQVTNAFARGVPTLPNLAPAATTVNGAVRWRRVRGSVQISIPVGIAAELRQPEEQLLSILRYIQKSIPEGDRWHAAFQRYAAQIGQRVAGFGGNPDKVVASADGRGAPPQVQIQTAETTTLQRQVRLTAVVSDSSGSALKFRWSSDRSVGKIHGDTAVVDFQLVAGPGPYVFTVTVTNALGLSASASITINFVGR